MAIYNQRAGFTREQFSAHFQQRNSLVEILYSIIRVLVIVVENLYCIPSYFVLSWLILVPINWLRSDLYSRLENYLYNSLIFIVSSWSLSADLTVVESGDEFKHLIEEPKEHYPGPATKNRKQAALSSNCNNNNLISNTKRYLDANCRVVVNGFANKSVNGHLEVNNHSNLNTRTRSSNKLKCNGLVTDGVTSNRAIKNNNYHNGDHLYTNGESINNNKQENNNHVHNETYQSLDTCADDEFLKSSNNNDSKKATFAKQNGRYSCDAINPNKVVTRETSMTPRIINEQHSLKTVQAKPRILLLCNHISTADVPLMMQSFSTLTNQSILWVLDAQFKMTNFGVVCGSHGDFFVAKNSYVDGSLREHVLKYPDRNLLVLFPEGGFLRKRIDGSNRYALRNNLPLTKNVTHPRFGAFKDLTDPSVGITHIVDATLIYDDINNPISILNIALGNKKEPAILHYKVYNRSEITPNEEWLRSIWLEKDRLLTKYYEDKESVLKQMAATFRVATQDWFKVLSVHLFYLLVCYLAIFRLFSATSVTMLKAREMYYSNI